MAVVGSRGRLYDHMLEKLQFGPAYVAGTGYKHLVQNRSGIIAVSADATSDVIYGSGAYDGRFNMDFALR
jgi:hypothetical protein